MSSTVDRYSQIYPGIWDGSSALEIAETGGAAAQLMALYLTTNPACNMIGLYPLDPLMMRVHVALTPRQIATALAVLDQIQFAHYDSATKVVWVREMAKFQLGLQHRPLSPTDKRVVGVQRLYASVRGNPWLGAFFDRYQAELHLNKRRDFEGVAKPLPEGLRRGFTGASEGITSPLEASDQSAVQQGSGDQELQQEQKDQRRSRVAMPSANENDNENPALLTKLAHGVLDDVDAGKIRPDEDKDELKDRAAKAGLERSGDRIRKALDCALAQRPKPARKRSA